METIVTVSLRQDQWPAVLVALEIAAQVKHKEFRDVAEAVLLELRMEIRQQVEGGGRA